MATLTIADLDNGKRDLQTVDAVANSRAATATTRFGQQTTTLYEAIRRIVAAGDAQLAEQKESAEAIIRNLGFMAPVPYAAGIEVASTNFTVIGPDGNIYAAQPGQVPFTTGAWDDSQWFPIQNSLNDHKLLVFSTLLEAETAAATLPDGQMVSVLDGSGSFEVESGALVENAEFDFQKNYVAGTIGASLKAWVNVKAFPFLAKGDGVSDDTGAIRAAIATGINVFIPEGVYKITGGIHQQRGQLVQGAGCDQWDFPSTTGKLQYMGRGTTILASGVCDDYIEVFGVTENRLTGGVTPNDTGDASEFAEYAISDFTNKDATGTGTATLKKIRCAWVVDEASNASLAKLRIQLNYNGIDGYNDSNLTGLGDEYDIGLMVLNSSFCLFSNVQVVGYWRMGALAHVNSEHKSVGLLKMGEGCFNTFDHCFFQGLRGAILRGADEHPVVSVVAGVSFTVPLTASNLIEVGDTLTDGSSGYTVTALASEDDLLRITVAGGTPNVGALLRHVRYNFGVAGAVLRDCVITGLFHKSRRSPKDLGMTQGSIALEASGGILRDFDFINCHIFDGECLLYANTVDDLGFVASYMEPYGTQYTSGTWKPSGAKVIVQGYGSASWAKYPTKGVRNITFDRSSEINANVDLFPWNVIRPARFTDAGYFRPQSSSIDANGSQVLNPFPKQGWGVPTTIVAQNGSGTGRAIRFLRPDFSYLGRVNESTGNWGFGPKDPQSRLHVSTDASESASGNHDAIFDAPNAGVQLRSTVSGAKWGRIVNNGTALSLTFSSGQNSTYSTNAFTYSYSTPELAVEGNIRHFQDNVHSFGLASRRATTIHLGSNPIVTSDVREKQQIRELLEAERRVGARLKHLIRAFKYNDAVVLKGDDARVHVGWIAQEVKEAFEAEGLDGFRYGCLCYDEWDAQPGQQDDEGNVIQPQREAGNRYGIRESQLLTFIISAI